MPKQDNLTTVNELKSNVRSFVNDRDWQSFHTPRNLAASISIEAAELLEIFQWNLEPAKIDKAREAAIEEELSDVLIYCLSLSNVLNIDITSSIKNYDGEKWF